MKERRLTDDTVKSFEKFLRKEEKSANTIEKYIRDVKAFAKYADGQKITKEKAVEYKNSLVLKGYAVRSINSMLVPLNSLFMFLGWKGCRVKLLKLQRQIFCPEEKELTKAEYAGLVNTAKKQGNERLNLILQTICGTGIRVSELSFVTVEAVRQGKASVFMKSKTRTVFFVESLKKKLLCYAKKQRITAGVIFVTRTGKPISSINIWREMKKLCENAKVNPQKVFPHNLRHLFARTFYGIEKDIAKLADILGHSSINTTRIYIVSTGAEHICKMEKMKLII